MREDVAVQRDTCSERDLTTWRLNVLNRILVLATILACIPTLILIAGAVSDPRRWPSTLAFVFLYLLLVALAVFRQLGLQVRLWGLLMLAYAAGVLALAHSGLAGDGRLYLLALSMLALVLAGRRAGLTLVVVSTLTFATFTLASHLGWTPRLLASLYEPQSHITWVLRLIAFTIVSAVLTVLQRRSGEVQRRVAAENLHVYKESGKPGSFNENIVHNLQEGILLENTEGYVTFANPKAGEMLGYAPEDLVGRQWRTLVASGHAKRAQKERARCYRGTSVRYESLLFTQNGQQVPVVVSMHPMHEEGRFTGLLSVLTNISERKRMEHGILESEARLRGILSSLHETIIVVFDREGTLGFVQGDPELARRYGVEWADFTGRPAADVFPPQDAENKLANLRHVFESGQPLRDTYAIRLPTGAFWHDITLAPMQRSSGDVTAVVGFIRDITKSKQALEALRDKEKMLKAVLNATTESILLVSDEHTILTANQTAARRLGAGEEDVVGLGVEDFMSRGVMSSELVESRLALLKEVFRTGQPVRAEDVRGDRHLDTSYYPIFDERGQVTRLAVFSQDITARRQAEQEAIRVERLAAMGQMGAALAHEINNPLQAIRSNIELLLDFDLDKEEHEECLGAALGEIKRAIGMTQRVLGLIQPGNETRYPVPVSRLIQMALTTMSGKAQQCRIEIGTGLPADPLYVFVAPDQITQVFLNLMTNAVEAMPGGGHLQIAAQAKGNEISVSMANSGPHLTQDELDHLFNPFYTTKLRGTGLGLAISHTIVDQHGGQIKAENQEGERGVTFTITLPAGRITTQQDTAQGHRDDA